MAWPIVPLGRAIELRKEFITVDDEASYNRCRVQVNAKGVVPRDRVMGADIKTKKQQVCRASEFLVAEIDAKHGGYGVVPDALDGAIVSSHYFLFSVDSDQLDVRYLHWYSQSTAFFSQVAAQGSTNYAAIRPDHVLQYAIPLPSIEEQQAIAVWLDGIAERLEARKQAAVQIEAELQMALRAAFEKIAVDAPRARMGDVAPLVRRPVKVDLESDYPELGVRSFGRGLFEKPFLRGEDLTWQKLYRIEEGDIVFSNIKAWEGAFAVARAEHHGMVGSHRYLTCVPNLRTVTADFVHFYLQTPEGLMQVQQASPGSADRNRTLGLRALENIEVPLPPIDAQLWFDEMQAKAQEVWRMQVAAEAEAQALIPSLLHQLFTEDAPESRP